MAPRKQTLTPQKRHPTGCLFFRCVIRCLLRFGRVDEGLDLQDGLAWVGIRVDRDRFGLVVLLAFGIELDFNLAVGTGGDGLLGALRDGASTRAFALVQNEGLTARVGEAEDVGHGIPFIHGAKVVLVRVKNHRGRGTCRLLRLDFGRVELLWLRVDRCLGSGFDGLGSHRV